MIYSIALALLWQTPVGAQPVPAENLSTSTGRAVLRSGLVLEFIGACQLADAAVKPWGLDGKPLGKDKAIWFWHALDADPRDGETRERWREKRETRTFAIALRHKPNALVNLSTGTEKDLRILSSTFKPPDVASGFTWPTESFVFEQPLGDDMSFVVEVCPFDATRMFEFDLQQRNWPSGFDFQFSEERREAVELIKGKRSRFTIVEYVVSAKVPVAWAGTELELSANDLDEKRAIPFPLPFGTGEVGADGRVEFDLSVKDRPGFKRVFRLGAKPKAIVTFKGIPLRHR